MKANEHLPQLQLQYATTNMLYAKWEYRDDLEISSILNGDVCDRDGNSKPAIHLLCIQVYPDFLPSVYLFSKLQNCKLQNSITLNGTVTQCLLNVTNRLLTLTLGKYKYIIGR